MLSQNHDIKIDTLIPEEDYTAHMQTGHLYFAKDEYEKAVEAYTAALNGHNNAEAYFWRGTAHAKIKKNQKLAIKNFEKAIDVNPDHIMAHISLGWAWYNKNKDKKCDASYYFSKGLSCYFQNKPIDRELTVEDIPAELIKDVIINAILRHPIRQNRIQLYLNCLNEEDKWGSILWKPQNTFLGFAPFQFQQCNEDKGTLKTVKLYLSQEYTKEGEEKLLKAESFLLPEYKGEEEILSHGQLVVQAAEDFANALIHNPANGEAYFGLGKCHEKQENDASALFNYQQAVHFFTDKIQYYAKEEYLRHLSLPYLQRAHAYFHQGLYAQAILDLKQALNNKDACRLLKQIFSNLIEWELQQKKTFKVLGADHILYKVYEAIPPADLWTVLDTLSGEERIAIFEFSALIPNHLANNLTRIIRNTLANDYIVRAATHYFNDQTIDAVEDYQLALHYCPTHPIALRQLERIKHGLTFCPAKANLMSTLNEDLSTAKNAKDKSAHDVREIERHHLTYYFKPERSQLAYMTAVANRFYRLMLPWNVAPNKVLVNIEGEPMGILSKGIPGFKTFRDIKKKHIKNKNGDVKKGEEVYIKIIHDKYLAIPKYYRKFYKMCVVARSRREDDFHEGNICIDLYTGKLYFFDTDESMLDVRSKFTGGRFGVDIPLGNRDPQTTFPVAKEDIRQFPRLTVAKPHYFPGRQADHFADTLTRPIIKHYTENLYSDEFINMVVNCDTLNRIEKLKIHFSVSLRSMLYHPFDIMVTQEPLSEHAAAIAALDLPADASLKGENLIDMVMKGEIKNNNQFWSAFSSMPEFQSFLQEEEKQNHPALYKCLLICLWHNQKLAKSAKKYPERANALTAAIFPLEKMIQNYNKLVKLTENHFKKMRGFISVKEIDPVGYLEAAGAKLEKDLKHKQRCYDQFFNQGKQKPEKSHATNAITLFGNSLPITAARTASVEPDPFKGFRLI